MSVDRFAGNVESTGSLIGFSNEEFAALISDDIKRRLVFTIEIAGDD